MSEKKKVILIQDKNYKSKIPTKTLNNAINKLKKREQEHYDITTNIGGFEINGGTGLTKSGRKLMADFDKWAREKNMRAIYNSKEDMELIRDNLRISTSRKT